MKEKSFLRRKMLKIFRLRRAKLTYFQRNWVQNRSIFVKIAPEGGENYCVDFFRFQKSNKKHCSLGCRQLDSELVCPEVEGFWILNLFDIFDFNFTKPIKIYIWYPNIDVSIVNSFRTGAVTTVTIITVVYSRLSNKWEFKQMRISCSTSRFWTKFVEILALRAVFWAFSVVLIMGSHLFESRLYRGLHNINNKSIINLYEVVFHNPTKWQKSLKG